MSGVFETQPWFDCSVNTGNYFNKAGAGVRDGDEIQFRASTFPTAVGGDIAVDTTYYAVNAVNTFYIARTLGGAAIDITGIGSGVTFAFIPSVPREVGVDIFPVGVIKLGRHDTEVTSYKQPPPADKLEDGYRYDDVVGTLSAGGGGEGWS